MNKVWKKRWLAALRSGNYRQGRGKLRTTGGAMCCLGVLCDLKNPAGWVDEHHHQGNDGWLKDSFKHELGLTDDQVCDLITINDSYMPSAYSKVIAWIEERL